MIAGRPMERDSDQILHPPDAFEKTRVFAFSTMLLQGQFVGENA